jgi:ribosomal protein S12 methylthiotransferase accessory factor YcaO
MLMSIIWYFAYGSNMQSATLRGRRGIEYRRALPGRLDWWRRVLDKGNEFELQLFALKVPRIRNLPRVVCYLVGESEYYEGHRCCGDVDTAIMRAISEALQSYATTISGSREDIVTSESPEGGNHDALETPRRRSLRIETYKEQTR